MTIAFRIIKLPIKFQSCSHIRPFDTKIPPIDPAEHKSPAPHPRFPFYPDPVTTALHSPSDKSDKSDLSDLSDLSDKSDKSSPQKKSIAPRRDAMPFYTC